MFSVKRSSLLSVLAYFITLSASADQSSLDAIHAQNWAIQCYKQMSFQELQMTANILYLLYANAIIDSTVQQFFTPISRLTQSILLNMNDIDNPNNDIITLKKLLKKLSIVTNARMFYTETLNTCFNYYDQNQTDSINAALQELQLYGQTSLRSWAKINCENTIMNLQNCEKVYEHSAQLFHASSGFHKGLSEGALPVEVNQDDKELIKLHIILNNAETLIEQTNTIINTINDSCDHAMSIICAGIDLYRLHYHALYTIIASPSFDQNYATTLFSAQGLLPEEYKMFLPHPHQVANYILQTTKLSIPTEIIQ